MKTANTVLDYDQIEFTIGYEKWLQQAFSELSVEELDEMEEDFFKSSAVKNRIVTLKPLNNPYYQPYQGA